MPENKPIIETYYPTYQWNYIWGNLSSVFILLKEREVLFKFIHEVLPTKKRLKEMKRSESSKCNLCDQEESNIHMVYYCTAKYDIVIWFKSILRKYCGVQVTNFINLLFLDPPKSSKKIKNTCISLIATYIVCMWYVRDKNMDTNGIIRYIKGEIVMKHRYIEYAMANKFRNMITQHYFDLDKNDI